MKGMKMGRRLSAKEVQDVLHKNGVAVTRFQEGDETVDGMVEITDTVHIQVPSQEAPYDGQFYSLCIWDEEKQVMRFGSLTDDLMQLVDEIKAMDWVKGEL